MASQLGPIEINCDAPPYAVVRACHRLGFRNPEDVPWYRFGAFVSGHYTLRAASLQAVIAALGFSGPPREHCLCGGYLPDLAWCTFLLQSGREESYRIGQCHVCRTIFWDEADPDFGTNDP
jgi:hypothetical protein